MFWNDHTQVIPEIPTIKTFMSGDFLSDLVLLNGNPLDDINQSQNIEGAMMGNLWMNKEYITIELKKLEKSK